MAMRYFMRSPLRALYPLEALWSLELPEGAEKMTPRALARYPLTLEREGEGLRVVNALCRSFRLEGDAGPGQYVVSGFDAGSGEVLLSPV